MCLMKNSLCTIWVLLAVVLLSGCGGTYDSFIDELDLPKLGDRDESSKELSMPPGLYAPVRQARYNVPDSKASKRLSAMSDSVLPQRMDLKLQREGNTVWLSVKMNPVDLWPHIKNFWTQYGFQIANENPTYGSIETNWLEQVVSTQVDMRVRDRFITRLYRDSNAITHIYIVNRKNTMSNGQIDMAFSDTETEVNLLYDLMTYLVSLQDDPDPATTLALEEVQFTVDIQNQQGVPVLTIGHSYDQVWRLLGSALNRAEVEIVNTDRSRKIYLVRYRQSDEDAFVKAHDSSKLIQLHLLPKNNETIITAHKNHSDDITLSYEAAHSVLKRIVNAY